MMASPFVHTALGKGLVGGRGLIDQTGERILILRTDSLDKQERCRYMLQAAIDRFSDAIHRSDIHTLWLQHYGSTFNMICNIKSVRLDFGSPCLVAFLTDLLGGWWLAHLFGLPGKETWHRPCKSNNITFTFGTEDGPLDIFQLKCQGSDLLISLQKLLGELFIFLDRCLI